MIKSAAEVKFTVNTAVNLILKMEKSVRNTSAIAFSLEEMIHSQ